MAVSRSTRRVVEALNAHGIDVEVQEMPVLMDEDLLAFDVIWAAAGTPKSVFPLAPSALRAATGATVLPVRGVE